MYNPGIIANYFVQKSFDTGIELTPMKLVKLVFIAHGWHLGIEGEPLINEVVQAWKYGPVISSVYHDFKKFGTFQITEPKFIPDCNYQEIDIDTILILDRVWEQYNRFTGPQLSNLTHQPNTPWDIIWNQENGKNEISAIIPNELIRKYYKSKADNQQPA